MKKFALKIGILLCSILVAMIIMEIVLRIFYTEEAKRSVTYDKDLGWGGIPFAEGVYIRKADSTCARYKFNELGFRDEFISSLSDSSIRLVLLGDSFVESMEVEYDSTFHRRVEHMLKSGINNNIDVVNVSSQGYSTAQEILALEKYEDIIRPNIVILVFYTGNDFSDNTRSRFAAMNQEGKLQFVSQKESWLRMKYSLFMSWLYDNSHMVYFIKNVMQSNFNLSWFANPAAIQKANDSEKYERRITELLILNLKERLEVKRIPFGIVIIPEKNEISGHNSSNADFIEEVCINNYITCLNLYGKLHPEHFLKVDTHFNIEGHHIASSIIYDFLVKHYFSADGL